MDTTPQTSGEFVLNLDSQFLQQAIDSLEFVQLKGLILILLLKSTKFEALRRKITDSSRG
jgi:hypothetical protein